MAITLTLDNMKEAELVLDALSVHYDIADDTVLEDLYMTTGTFHKIARDGDDNIQRTLQQQRDDTNARINELVLTGRLLERMRSTIAATISEQKIT